jgi:predicted phosphodiesterase
MKLGWISDIHLNFLDGASRAGFLDSLGEEPVDAWLLSGDVGEADTVVGYLKEIVEAVHVPVLFVLGNHDFYRGSISEVRSTVEGITRSQERLVWLSQGGPQYVAPGLVVVGDDGWADARLGDPLGTPIELNDFLLIKELSGLARAVLVGRLNELGDESAARLSPKLVEASAGSETVIVLTHVPPFEGSCWHEGKVTTPDWLPWFTCDAVGRTILHVANDHPDTRFLVLCGHTHSPGRFFPAQNVVVLTAKASYGDPSVQRILEFFPEP